MLINHYTSRERIEQLLSLGGLCCLGKELYPDPNKTHNSDVQQKDVCVFYSRDRGEDFESNQKFQIDLEKIYREEDVDYCYVFTKDDQWLYFYTHERSIDYDYDNEEAKPKLTLEPLRPAVQKALSEQNNGM
jgi:hypothetical protein